MSPKTLYDKIWDAHVAHEAEDGTSLQVLIHNEMRDATVVQDSLYDPTSAKARL